MRSVILAAAVTSLHSCSCAEQVLPAWEDAPWSTANPNDDNRANGEAGCTPPRVQTDILFVVDNSASMSEEQTNLARSASSFCYPGRDCENACNSEERLAQVKDFWAGPGCGHAPEDWPALSPEGALAKSIWDDCGFLEQLAIHNVDYRIGFITTDLKDTDVEFGLQRCQPGQPQRAPLPQRGCLQASVAGVKVIAAEGGTHSTRVQELRDVVHNIGICGSGFEAGLEAARVFLTPDSERAHASCAGDLTAFQRSEAGLLLVFVSDEEDCSHRAPVDDNGIDDARLMDAQKCYTQPQELLPPADFTTFFAGLKPHLAMVRAGAIIGGTYDGDGEFIAGSCRCNISHLGAQPVSQCFASKGLSNVPTLCGETVSNDHCGAYPDHTRMPNNAEPPSEPCCTADAAPRYLQAISGLAAHAAESLCVQDFTTGLRRFGLLAR